MDIKTIQTQTLNAKNLSHNDVEHTLIHAVTHCADETGWANLAEIGTHLRNAGIQYGKLSRFLNDFAHIVEKKIDTSVTPPVVLAKLVHKN